MNSIKLFSDENSDDNYTQLDGLDVACLFSVYRV